MSEDPFSPFYSLMRSNIYVATANRVLHGRRIWEPQLMGRPVLDITALYVVSFHLTCFLLYSMDHPLSPRAKHVFMI